jgi:MFS family permease
MTAVMASMFGYACMTLVMTSTPLAMVACGYGFRESATVIQWHIIAMFAPSFFTGHLIQRFGVLPIIITGAVIEFGCALVNLAGIDFWNFLIANVLVGLGWNFAYVGGSTLLTRTYEPVERAKVQASHDFTVYATTATAALASGVMHATAGWAVINYATLPLMLSIVLAALWLMIKQQTVRAQAQQS